MAKAKTDNERLVMKFFEVLSAGKLDTFKTLLHSDAVWTVMPSAVPGTGPHNGRKGIVDEFLAPVRGLFVDGDPKLHVKNVFGSGAWVAAEVNGVGTFKSGTEYNNNYCWIFEIKDNMVLQVHEYMDSHYIMNVVA